MADQHVPGTSTLGVLLGYGTGSTQPAAYTTLHRINSTGEINITPETIDASALEDYVEKSIAGRASTGGQFDVVVNATPETITEWQTLISAYKALGEDEYLWLDEYYPKLNRSFITKVEPPQQIPKPAADQNSLLTITMTMTIVDYIGVVTAIEPTDATSSSGS